MPIRKKKKSNLVGASSLALAVYVGPIIVLQYSIAFFLASENARISPLMH